MESTTESMVGLAFTIGLVSAASLPLGAYTGLRFQFSDRAIAFMMAFGGGALLAALTLDLVATSLADGHYVSLAIGWMIGGLLFIQLNNIINDFGGFSRKVSTRIYQGRRTEQKRFRAFVRNIQQLDIFDDLPRRDYDALRASVEYESYKKGEYLLREADPVDDLYVIVDGSVAAVRNEKESVTYSMHQAIGEHAFLVGAPCLYDAVAMTDCSVVKLPRSALLNHLPNSPMLIQTLTRWLQRSDVHQYLLDNYDLRQESLAKWLSVSGASLMARGHYEDLLPVERHASQFIELVKSSDELPLFSGLPDTELAEIAARLIYKERQPGHTFYHKTEQSERVYILAHGNVDLIDPSSTSRKTRRVGRGQGFGHLSFLAGALHSVNAVAGEEVELWQLMRADFEELLEELPYFANRVRKIVGDPQICEYLIHRHNMSSANANIWQRKATTSIRDVRELPQARSMQHDLSEHKGAPLAIWLGIALDGIPEALVIGASLVSSKLSISLVVGLFISNYPEALSSSAGMREQGYSRSKIILLWFSLALLTGVLAALGNLYFVNASHELFVIIEGVAAGAMLTMIAQTMLPEAYIRGGSIIGFATLLGFFAVILLKGVA